MIKSTLVHIAILIEKIDISMSLYATNVENTLKNL